MTAEQFAYWMQGFTELHGEPPTPAQWQMIKDHLALVFNKVTPNYPPNVAPFTPVPPMIGLPAPIHPWLTPNTGEPMPPYARTFC